MTKTDISKTNHLSGADEFSLRVSPANGIRGAVGTGQSGIIPGDKSISHRAALLASMAVGESIIENFLVSGVTNALLGALTSMAIDWELSGSSLRVEGKGVTGFKSPNHVIDCGNSGTTMRFLAGAIAASGVSAVLDGSSGLRRRPMKRITDPLRMMGVQIDDQGGRAPLAISSSQLPLLGLAYTLPVASAQVKSCLLFAGLSAGGGVILREPGRSRDHTERMLRSMGVPITSRLITGDKSSGLDKQEGVVETNQPQFYPGQLKPLDFTIPGDISAASFLIVAALITPGSELSLFGVGLNPTRIGLLETLLKMGGQIRISNKVEIQGELIGDIHVKNSHMRGVEVSGELVVRMIDEFPIFSIAAACAEGRTVVKDAEELRYKESDRITALTNELQSIGVQIRELPDGFEIDGGIPLSGGKTNPHGDHRLAMSLVIAGLISDKPVIVEHAEILRESFPNFIELMCSLGAKIEVTANK